MFKLRKVISIIVFFILISSFLPVNIKAANDINIISTTKIKVEEAKAWATKKSGTNTFVKLADLYWNNYKSHGNINPAIAYVQSALETGYGKFGGVIDESYKNPCGMKVNSGGGDTDSNAHQRFNSWEDGVKAHLDHLALYAGAIGYPRNNTTDPRHFSYILGKAKTVQALSTTWSSSKSYGDNIIRLYNELNDFSDNIKIVEDIESEGNLSILNNKINIKGWAISKNTVSKVMVYLDDKYVGNANYGISREDVYNAYPDYKNSKNSGYSINIDVSNINNGNHKLKIVYQGAYGYTLTSYSNIIINKNENNSSYMPPRGRIDYPSENESIKEKSIRIKGWALNSSGIKEVKVYIDGTYICKASLGVPRDDVNATYPNYPNGDKSGYYADINLSNISYGKKKITVEEIGLNGEVNYNERNFQYIKNKLIVIDAGHGGTDSGAISTIGGVNYIEKDINLKIALKLSNDLKNRGYDVKLIRSLDTTVSLDERAKRANNLNADLFISIHQNSVTSSLANGTEVYYTTSMPDSGFPVHQTNKLSKSKELASLVCNNVVSALGTTNRGVKIDNFKVLRNTSMPSILVECGFITNKADALKISNETYQNKIAKAIGAAVESKKYLDSNLNIISFSVNKASPQVEGSEITLKASASGNGNLQYKFVVSDLKGNTTLIKDYSKENTALWNANYVGDKILTVYVKDSQGNISKKTMSYCIKPITIEISSFTADKSSPQEKGSKVTLKASASGDGNLQYKFVISDLNGNATLIKDYSKENTALWNANYVGDKILTVYVKDSQGSISKKTMPYCIKPTTIK
ncbi:MAG: N-acetylmuramoyl-L-alanine amidase [Clostridium sp.]|nr:N-acetylmuramoyl-L-alanine amidase [Clostridium sp.]